MGAVAVVERITDHCCTRVLMGAAAVTGNGMHHC
jgi:hypothetical protein